MWRGSTLRPEVGGCRWRWVLGFRRNFARLGAAESTGRPRCGGPRVLASHASIAKSYLPWAWSSWFASHRVVRRGRLPRSVDSIRMEKSLLRVLLSCGALSASLLLLNACGRGPASTPASPASEKASSGPGAPGVPWAQKKRQEREDWMGLEVLPQMKALFIEHDPEGYADFQCQVCHGDNMELVDFEMPSAELYALSPTAPVEDAMDYDEEVTRFMVEAVVPKMATLLSTEPYDPESQSGFGCFGCHPAAD